MKNPFSLLSKHERILYISSVCAIIISFLSAGSFSATVLVASLTGATALIFVSKGEPIGQILTIVFALLYAVVSYEFKYYGEMITYLGMTTPTAAAAAVSWFKNPYQKGKSEVRVGKITLGTAFIMIALSAAVTVIFYYILNALSTPNIVFSTISIFTSFVASFLTVLRSPYYALAYSANDIILIVLWILASKDDISYFPMVICFFIFLINDAYGFFNWRKMKTRQNNGKGLY